MSRIGRLGVDGRITAGTFHAIALAQLRRHATERNREPPRILERKARILGPILGARGPSASIAVADIAAEIEWAKARLIGPDRYQAAAEAAGRRPPRAVGEVARVYAAYEAEKRKRHVIDFDDVLSRCADAIARDEEFAAGQRWRFRHLFVDEFQDATPLQLRLLRAWLGDANELTVVGDPAQAIYGFTGADASPSSGSSARFRAGRRSCSAGTTGARPRSSRSPRSRSEMPRATGAVNRRRSVPTVPPPTITGYDDDDAEARAIADACWRAHAAGVPWHRMAVLFRTNAQSSRFEAALTKRGVPFRIGEGQRFTARAPVRALLDELREAERTRPGLPFGQYLADLAAAATRRRKPETGSEARSRCRCSKTPPGRRNAGSDDARPVRSATRCSSSGATTSKRSVASVASPSSRPGWTPPPARGRAAPTASTSSRSTAPRGSSGPSCSSPASSGEWCRSPGRPRRKPRPRNAACCTSRSVAPKTSCTSRGPGRGSSGHGARRGNRRPGSAPRERGQPRAARPAHPPAGAPGPSRRAARHARGGVPARSSPGSDRPFTALALDGCTSSIPQTKRSRSPCWPQLRELVALDPTPLNGTIVDLLQQLADLVTDR